MKIALFSDIHANLPALEACFKSMDEHQPDAIYCLGDLVGYNVWPSEVIREIRHRRIPTIAGNYDEAIASMTADANAVQKAIEANDSGKLSKAYTSMMVQEDERNYLRTLPAHIRIEFKLNQEKFNLLLVHGSPRKINEYLHADQEEAYLLELMHEANADLLCFGHTHQPYHKIMKDELVGEIRYKHAINIGSVGKPKDGNPDGCYVLLHFDEHSSLTNTDSIKVEFVRFSYDVEQAAKAVEDSILSNQFADMLRKAY